MSRTLFSVFLCLSQTLVLGQKHSDAFQQMVNTERQFAQTSVDKSTKIAFSTFLSQDAIVFNNGNPINGLAFWQQKPESDDLLKWTPVYAHIATSGDLGFTTGPWEYFAQRTHNKPASTGTFVTLWRKQTDGNWQVALDIGISNPLPPNEILNNPSKRKISRHQADTAMVKMALLSADYLLSRAILKQIPSKAYELYLSDDSRFYRFGSQPFVEKSKIQELLTKPSQQMIFEPLNGGVSLAGDFGYVYGNAKMNDKTGNYLRIWRKEAKRDWRIMLELVNLPAE